MEKTLKLDYSIESPEERNKVVTQIIEELPPEKLTPYYLEILSNYLVFAMDKEERKTKRILTSNHMVTVNKRETSLQALSDKLVDGEDGINGMIANDKDIIFTPKISITEDDLNTVPGLRELRESIDAVEAEARAATGKRKYLLKQQAIEMRQDQYVMKNAYKPTVGFSTGANAVAHLSLDEHITMDEKQEPHSDCVITFFNPQHVSALLRHYSSLKESVWGKFETDAYFLMEDLDNLIEETLRDDYPYYYDLLIDKIDGMSNQDIQTTLNAKYDVRYSTEYLSSLWRNKIPKMLSEKAKEDYIVWYYTNVEYGHWKRCSCCGQIKLAHPRFFSKNNTSKDGYYSICKECRKKKYLDKTH